MNKQGVSFQRAGVAPVNVLRASLALAVAWLISIPVADAFQTTAGLPIGIHDAQQVGYSTGRIQKLDIERATVTLKHGPIAGLGMPDMTMIFRVSNPRQLAGLNVGDQVRFEVRKVKSALIIFSIDKFQ